MATPTNFPPGLIVPEVWGDKLIEAMQKKGPFSMGSLVSPEYERVQVAANALAKVRYGAAYGFQSDMLYIEAMVYKNLYADTVEVWLLNWHEAMHAVMGYRGPDGSYTDDKLPRLMVDEPMSVDQAVDYLNALTALEEGRR